MYTTANLLSEGYPAPTTYSLQYSLFSSFVPILSTYIPGLRELYVFACDLKTRSPFVLDVPFCITLSVIRTYLTVKEDNEVHVISSTKLHRRVMMAFQWWWWLMVVAIRCEPHFLMSDFWWLASLCRSQNKLFFWDRLTFTQRSFGLNDKSENNS